MPDDIVQQLKDAACGNDCHCHYCERNKAAANEIERLRKERDEARLLYLQLFNDPRRWRRGFKNQETP